MNFIQWNRNQLALFIMAICSAALVAAWISEYIFGLAPCTLCIYQRYLYLGSILVLAIHQFMLNGRYSNSSFILSTLVLLACSAVAGYQVAVENHWVELPQVCTSNLSANSVEELKSLIYAQASVPCDEVQFSLFGFSMAAYNSILALFLGLINLSGVTLYDEKKKKFARR